MGDGVTIALIDDDAAVLDSTAMLLRRLAHTVVTFASAEEFLAGHAGLKTKPEVIVSDVRMPGLSGLGLQRELLQLGIGTPLILITGHGEVRMAVDAIKGGAADFIQKPFEIEDLVQAIRVAAANAKLKEDDAKRRAEILARVGQLSARQREVMDMVVEGYSSRQIAEKLGISARTVETYRLSIMEKMGAGSVAALVRMVIVLPPS